MDTTNNLLAKGSVRCYDVLCTIEFSVLKDDLLWPCKAVLVKARSMDLKGAFTNAFGHIRFSKHDFGVAFMRF